jgi:hypothetical protein
MTIDIHAVEKASNPYAKQILYGSFILVVLLLFVVYTPYLAAFRVPLALLLPFLLIYGIVLAIRIYQAVDMHLPLVPFLSGSLLLAGGATFDGIVTIIKSPTLSREANPIARSLLDSGISPALVIFHGTISQIAFVLFVCILWAAFLKHKDTMIALTKSKNEQSGWGFIKAALGGAHLSWRQFLIPYKFSEFPIPYYLLWPIPVCLIWAGIHRWYLGFVWLGLPSLPLDVTVTFATVLPLVGYIIWLWNKYMSKP